MNIAIYILIGIAVIVWLGLGFSKFSYLVAYGRERARKGSEKNDSGETTESTDKEGCFGVAVAYLIAFLACLTVMPVAVILGAIRRKKK